MERDRNLLGQCVRAPRALPPERRAPTRGCAFSQLPAAASHLAGNPSQELPQFSLTGAARDSPLPYVRAAVGQHSGFQTRLAVTDGVRSRSSLAARGGLEDGVRDAHLRRRTATQSSGTETIFSLFSLPLPKGDIPLPLIHNLRAPGCPPKPPSQQELCHGARGDIRYGKPWPGIFKDGSARGHRSSHPWRRTHHDQWDAQKNSFSSSALGLDTLHLF